MKVAEFPTKETSKRTLEVLGKSSRTSEAEGHDQRLKIPSLFCQQSLSPHKAKLPPGDQRLKNPSLFCQQSLSPHLILFCQQSPSPYKTKEPALCRPAGTDGD